MVEVSRFDPMQFLPDDDDQAELLAEALAEDSGAALSHVMREIGRARGLAELAAMAGLDRKRVFEAVLRDDAGAEARLILAALKARTPGGA